MNAHANLFVENKIRAGLRVTRLFVAYAPFNLVRRLQKLALYRTIEARDFNNANASRKAQLQHLVLTAGILQEEQWIDFSERALDIIRGTRG